MVLGNVARFPWVIVGCGYTGQQLARRLVEAGASVIGVRRSIEQLKSLGEELGTRFTIRRAVPAPQLLSADWLPEQSIVVDSVPPSGEGNRAYGDYERELVATVVRSRVRSAVYLSSTGVYPGGKGEWFDETTMAAPLSTRGAARLACETAFREAAQEDGLAATVLRIPGIYGPNRGIFSRLQSGTFRLIGDGTTHVSRIHVHDLTSAIIAAGLAADGSNIFTVADDEPCPSGTIVEAAIAEFGLPVPARVSVSDVSADIAAMVTANRKISNRSMKAILQVVLKYPTWREGMRSVVKRLC